MLEIRKIHEDPRGSIWQIVFGDKEFFLLETKSGFSRGGDYHQSNQHDLVLVGAIEYRKKYFIERREVLGVGEKVGTPSGVPHMFTALEDSLVLEWLEGDFEKQYYKPYRDVVEASSKTK